MNPLEITNRIIHGQSGSNFSNTPVWLLLMEKYARVGKTISAAIAMGSHNRTFPALRYMECQLNPATGIKIRIGITRKILSENLAIAIP